MSYSVRIEPLGADGFPLGASIVESVATASEAVALMRTTFERGDAMGQPLLISIYAPGNRLVASCSTPGAQLGDEPGDRRDWSGFPSDGLAFPSR